jgi:LuxR family maltose regulon positive regulatory protein
MIEHLPPDVRLVISGRTTPPLPLARLRAAGQLAQIDNLALTVEDAAVLLGLDADDALARLLHEQTGGWLAGLQLAALWMAERGENDTFGGGYRYLYDYFMEEVVEPQPATLKSFLMHTAVLDVLSGGVCDAVTGRDDGQAMLERLEQLKLFIMPLDGKRQYYRYHPLFGEFLREWLRKRQPDVSDLHLRASVWCERNGTMEQALDHAFEAGNWERGAALINACAERGIDTRRWIERLPEPMRTASALTEPLSEREAEVLEMLSTGMSNPEIASKLIIAVSTVKTHVKNIYRKLDVDTRYEAMQRAREMDLLALRLERDYRRLIQ